MSTGHEEFAELLTRVRQGDQSAAAELVRRFEPEVRRIVRLRLTDRRMRRVMDSTDVCQSVFANFFVRAWAGQYDLGEPGQLLALLVAMARNKVLDQARRQNAHRRDTRRTDLAGDDALLEIAGRERPPVEAVSDRDLIDEVRKRLTDDERYLADQRALDREWSDLAVELSAAPDALRKKLARALDRVTRELGLRDLDHD